MGEKTPAALLQKLEEAGFVVETPNKALAVPSAEKFIYGAQHGGKGAVVLRSKPGVSKPWEWNYQKELGFLQEVPQHENILKMLAWFPPAPDGSHGPCMVMERVDPLGFDLFNVIFMYKNAQGGSMPIAQWTHYLKQVLSAVEHMHAHGYVHCDIKPDNVLIDVGHCAKVIDFGLVRRTAKDLPPERSEYGPPEFSARSLQKVQPISDVWNIGAMMFTVFTQIPVKFSRRERGWVDRDAVMKKGALVAMKEWRWPVPAVDPYCEEAILGCLQHDMAKRWTMEQIRTWAEKGEGASVRDSLAIPVEGNFTQEGRTLFRMSAKLDKVVKAFGFQVKSGTSEQVGGLALDSFVGKFIGPGPHATDASHVLDFKQFLGATVLFIDRESSVVTIPKASDRIQMNDWLYIKLEEETVPETEEQAAFQMAAQDARKVGVEVFLQFDEFSFPEHCYGANVASGGEGKVGLDLRKNFGIGLTFIRRRLPAEDGTMKKTMLEIGGDTKVLPGDLGMVCRVPERGTGRAQPIISDDLLGQLFDETKFRQKLGLESDEAWATYLATSKAQLDAGQ